MGTAVTLMKAYHANTDLHARVASLAPTEEAHMQPPPQPSHASRPVHASSAGDDPYARRLVTPTASSATGMRLYSSKLPVLNEVASRRWSSQEAADNAPSLRARPAVTTTLEVQKTETVAAVDLAATDGPPSPTLQRPMHPYLSGIIATARSAITTTIETVVRVPHSIPTPFPLSIARYVSLDILWLGASTSTLGIYRSSHLFGSARDRSTATWRCSCHAFDSSMYTQTAR